MNLLVSRILKISAHPRILPFIVMGLRGSSLVVKFLLSIFIATYMDFSVLGSYGLVVSASIMLPVFAGFSLMYTISRKAVTESMESVTSDIGRYAQIMFFMYLLFGCLAIVTGSLFDKTLLAALIVLIVFFEHFNNDLYNLLLNLTRPFVANFLHFIRTALWMSIYMVGAYFIPEMRTLEVLLIGWVIGGFLSLLGFGVVSYAWPWTRSYSKKSLLQWFMASFKESRAIYAHNFLATLGQNIDRFLITFFLGLDLTGVYVFFGSVNSAMANLIRTGVVQIARPKLVRAFKEADVQFNQIYKSCLIQTCFISTAMALFAWPAMYYIIVYMDKPLALEWFNVFWIVLVMFILLMIVEVNKLVFYATHRDDLILQISLWMFPIAIVSHIAFMTTFGFLGAVISPAVLCLVGILFQYHYISEALKSERVQ